ncbi:MAG: hypothetical protein HY565_05560 [Candidatus Kerfeldbacteria bacterium]|nr:hypothetical protein [Candidatus Kerfeldbacteria bacterium]
MKKLSSQITLTLAALFALTIALPLQADIVEPISYAESCLVITNLNDYSEYVFVISTDNGKYGIKHAVIIQDECFNDFGIGSDADTVVLSALASDQFDSVMLDDIELTAELVSTPIDISQINGGFIGIDNGQIDYYEVELTDAEIILTLTDSEKTSSVYPSQQYKPFTSSDFRTRILGVAVMLGGLVLISLIGVVAITVLAIYLYRRRARKSRS